MANEQPVIEVVQALVPVRSRSLIAAEALREEADARALLKQFVKEQLVPDVDFGTIPGTKKPTLLKPGAEKLVNLYRCTPKYIKTQRLEDWDKPLFHYEFKCQLRLRDTDIVVAEGVGSANSMEARYRWRDAQRKCPACNGAFIIKGKEEYGGGWVCFKKKGGCGAKFKDGDQTIEGQPQGREENDDIPSVVNTILKIAKKRALVDAAVAIGGVSDLFTQDVEDGQPGHGEWEPPPPPEQQPDPQAQRQTAKPAPKRQSKSDPFAAMSGKDGGAKKSPEEEHKLLLDSIFHALMALAPGNRADEAVKKKREKIVADHFNGCPSWQELQAQPTADLWEGMDRLDVLVKERAADKDAPENKLGF